MERKETQKEMDDKTPSFDENMRMAQKAAKANQWKEFKRIIKENKIDMLVWFDLFGNTAMHVAARSDEPKLLKELLEMLPKNLLRKALKNRNYEGNTVLHEVIFCEKVEMADVVFKFDESPDEEVQEELKESIDEEVEEEMKESLLEITNKEGETPLFRVAKYGNLKMLKHLADYVAKHKVGDIRSHFHRTDKFSALHASVIGQYFDVALWLVRMDKGLAMEKDRYGFTCLQLLSKMPHVFRSHTRMRLVKNLTYHLLPEKGYEIGDGETLESFTNGRDLESGEIDDRNIPKSVISKINYGFWKSFAREFERIDQIWEQKKKHRLAECLTDILVKYDLSWQISHNGNIKTLIAMPTRPFNVETREIESKREEDHQENHEVSNYTPLLIAASNGIVEIVEKILDANPAAIFHVSKDDRNILHMAINHRQKEIYRIIKRKNALKSLGSKITKEGETILHQVSRMDYYKASQELAGLAFQLQDELCWYERVRRIVPHHYYMQLDIYQQTAENIFDINHDEMLGKAQKWLKETTQSCSTVAVLVATVVFAAAYTIPGGSEGGTPIFLHSPVFLFFTAMDVVGLATSLASVVMFLSILTSPCELWDFHKSLPRKLNLGFAFLFFSLITTMMTFSATILLTIRLELKNWTSTLVYTAAIFLVTVFVINQLPVYVMTESMVVQLGKLIKKVLPRRLIKCFTPKIEKKYIH